MPSKVDTVHNVYVQCDYVNILINFYYKFYRSWQVINFEKRPVTFVKIVGTHNTANEVSYTY